MIIEMPGAMQCPAFFALKNADCRSVTHFFPSYRPRIDRFFEKRNGFLLIFWVFLTKSCLYILAGYIDTDLPRISTAFLRRNLTLQIYWRERDRGYVDGVAAMM